MIALQANAPAAGYHFDHWTSSNGGVFSQVNSAQTTFTMPGNNATLSAEYEKNPTRTMRLTGDLDFGDVNIGNISQRTLSIHNDGDNTLSVVNIDFHESVDNIYAGGWSGDIAPGKSKNVTLTFTPQDVSYYPNVVRVNANHSSGNNEHSISGSGIKDDGDINAANWDIYDATPEGALISTVADPNNASNHVIKLAGSARDNGYRYTFPEPESNNFTIQWDAKYNENYTVYISCETTQGHRYLTYTAGLDDGSKIGNSDEYIHHDLSNAPNDGQWKSIVRNLQEDLWEKQTNADIIEVTAFLIRGSGYVDNIKMIEALGPIGWDVYDITPDGASVSNAADPGAILESGVCP